MELRFLGAAATVTGSQFLLTTKRAKVLIDCGMFQGQPNEGGKKNEMQLMPIPKLRDIFVLPEGASWRVSIKKEQEDFVPLITST